MKRRSLVLIPAVFLLLVNVTIAAEQPAVSGAAPGGDQIAQRQQCAPELQNQIDAGTGQTGLPSEVIPPNSPLPDERPGQIPFSFKLPSERRADPESLYRGARPYYYNGMTFWWIPLSNAASRIEMPAESFEPVKLLEPK